MKVRLPQFSGESIVEWNMVEGMNRDKNIIKSVWNQIRIVTIINS